LPLIKTHTTCGASWLHDQLSTATRRTDSSVYPAREVTGTVPSPIHIGHSPSSHVPGGKTSRFQYLAARAILSTSQAPCVARLSVLRHKDVRCEHADGHMGASHQAAKASATAGFSRHCSRSNVNCAPASGKLT
jgi:hypothetical protein